MSEVGDFLKARRARLTPDQVGLPSHGARRVPGLRREELAELAGVSVDYYVQLEQGRRPHVSAVVLDSVARALRLTPVEREHLGNLAAGLLPTERSGARVDEDARVSSTEVRHVLQRLVDLMQMPAIVLGQRMDFVAWNRAADAVFELSALPEERRNALSEVFSRPDAQERYPDWASLATDVVGALHRVVGRHPEDPHIARLIRHLLVSSPEFRQLWVRHDVRSKTSGSTTIRHPSAGTLSFTYQAIAVQAVPDAMIMAYTFDRDSATERGLALLASNELPTPGREAEEATRSLALLGGRAHVREGVGREEPVG